MNNLRGNFATHSRSQASLTMRRAVISVKTSEEFLQKIVYQQPVHNKKCIQQPNTEISTAHIIKDINQNSNAMQMVICANNGAK